MYLLIFESIGTSELILIGIVALIIFGPRKLPEMMRSFGRAMAEFRRSTNEFKQSWEKEVDIEALEKEVENERALKSESGKTVGRTNEALEGELVGLPEIKEIKGEDFDRLNLKSGGKDLSAEQITEPELELKEENEIGAKQDWL